jgi:hypothetical protein
MTIRPAKSEDAEALLIINIKARQDGYCGLVDQAYPIVGYSFSTEEISGMT